MNYIIKPVNYGISSDAKLIFYDVRTNKSIATHIVRKGGWLNTTNIFNSLDVEYYSLTIQSKKDGDWVTKAKGIKLVKPYDLGLFFSEQKKINTHDLNNLLKYYLNIDNKRVIYRLRVNLREALSALWINHSTKHENLNKFINILDVKKDTLPLIWQNIHFYLKHFYDIKKMIQSLNIQNHFYDDLLINNSNYDELNLFLQKKLDTIENSCLQFSYILRGQIYSFLGQRELAYTQFQKSLQFNNSWGVEFSVGKGVSTYSIDATEAKDYKSDDHIEFDIDQNQHHNRTILISVEKNFLRNYGIPILFTSLIFSGYNFHLHVITKEDDCLKAVNETKEFYSHMKEFYNRDRTIKNFTLSHERVPDFVEDISTYSACARFIHAKYFMEKFKTDIIVLDADMFIKGDLRPYFDRVSEYDITVNIAKLSTSFLPWRRVMAGSLFFKNNDTTLSFLVDLKQYILANFHHDVTWNLDQNALSYAFEQLNKRGNFKLSNTYKTKNPFSHPPVRTFIEKQ